jgi:ferritin-like metal-binding protein YciE
MKLILKRLRTINELYENQLQMLLSAEEQVVQLLLDMQQWATDDELRSTLKSFHDESELQVPRIRDLVSANTTETKPIRCKVVAALAAETEDMVADAADPTVRDVALITAAQRVKHYEIAVYGAIRDFATILGKHKSAEILGTSLREEKEADRVLTGIAERINIEAHEHVSG